MNPDDVLRLSYAGLHPDRRRELMADHGEAGSLLEGIRSGRVQAPERGRAAIQVGAPERRRQLAALAIAPLVRGADGFPSHLADLPDSPDLLFVRGALPQDRGVAVVGSRRATSYGRRLARSFGSVLAAAGWPVISGLARGVDGSAHRGAVDARGRGIAVMGCGLDRWYPAEHQTLGEELLRAGGAIISEYPPGAPPLAWHFPPRNRIISGLAAAVVVVEATRTGGALITARRALGQGREVLAVPGDVDRPTSEGCNLLIRDGAIPVLGPADLVEAVGLILGPPASGDAASGDEDDLLSALEPAGRTVDQLAMSLEVPVPELLARLARLEASGEVMRSEGVIMRRPADPAGGGLGGSGLRER